MIETALGNVDNNKILTDVTTTLMVFFRGHWNSFNRRTIGKLIVV